MKVPDRLRALLRAQQQKTRAAVEAEARAPSAATHTKVVAATERFVLVVDAVIRGSGFKDTRDAAKQLADVADDLAFGAQQTHDPEHGDARARGAVSAWTRHVRAGRRLALDDPTWARSGATSARSSWRTSCA